MKKHLTLIATLFLLMISTTSCLSPSDDEKPSIDGDMESESELESEDDSSENESEVDQEPDIERIKLDLIEGCNPFSTSNECVLPYPSSFFEKPDDTSTTGVRGNYPPDLLPNVSGKSHFDIESANVADGSSPAGPILMHFGTDLDPKFMVSYSEMEKSLEKDFDIALFDWDGKDRIVYMSEMDMNRVEDVPDRYAFIIRPMKRMAMGHRHLVVITKKVKDINGKELKSPRAFEVLRDKIYTTNDRVESIRDRYEEIFEFLDEQGYKRDDLFLVWDFVVASEDYVLGPIKHMRKEAMDMMKGKGLSYTVDSVKEDSHDLLAKIVTGTFEVPTYLNETNTFDYDKDHKPILQDDSMSFPYTMVIPRQARTVGKPLPLIVFGHGIFGSGNEYLTNSWAGKKAIWPMVETYGAIIVATDWIGLSNGDQDLIKNEIIPNINRIGLITDRLQQSLINTLTLQELTIGQLQKDDKIKINSKHELIDVDKIYYYGASLGGIQGTSFMALSNRVTRGVLTVPGSVWSNMLPRSIVWGSVNIFFNAEYPDPLVQQMGIAFMQTRFDHSDPLNLSLLMYEKPLDDAPDDRILIMQEAIGDCLVPNMTTEMLARSLNVKQLAPYSYPIFGLQETTAPSNNSAFAQYMIEQDFSPPETNVPPEKDNGVHHQIVFLPQTLDQSTKLLFDGVIEQYCDGSCDPD